MLTLCWSYMIQSEADLERGWFGERIWALMISRFTWHANYLCWCPCCECLSRRSVLIFLLRFFFENLCWPPSCEFFLEDIFKARLIGDCLLSVFDCCETIVSDILDLNVSYMLWKRLASDVKCLLKCVHKISVIVFLCRVCHMKDARRASAMSSHDYDSTSLRESWRLWPQKDV